MRERLSPKVKAAAKALHPADTEKEEDVFAAFEAGTPLNIYTQPHDHSILNPVADYFKQHNQYGDLRNLYAYFACSKVVSKYSTDRGAVAYVEMVPMPEFETFWQESVVGTFTGVF